MAATRPIRLRIGAGFLDHMLAFLDQMVADRFLKAGHRDMLLVDDDLDRLLGRMEGFVARDAGKWLDSVAKELT